MKFNFEITRVDCTTKILSIGTKVAANSADPDQAAATDITFHFSCIIRAPDKSVCGGGGWGGGGLRIILFFLFSQRDGSTDGSQRFKAVT